MSRGYEDAFRIAGAERGERDRTPLAGRMPLADGMKNGIEPPDELERDVMIRSRVHWAYAAGSAKTWLGLYLTRRCIERGEPVVYFDAENGHRIVSERLSTLGVSTERIDELLYYYPFPNLTTEPDVAADYLALLDEAKPALVVFDSLVNFLSSAGLEENSNDDVVRFAVAFLRPAREREIAVLVLDHVPHEGDHARGASRKRDEADGMWALRVPVPFDRNTVGRVVLRRDKDREAWLPERVTFSVGGSEDGFIFRRSDGTIEESNPEDGLTGTERRTLDALREVFGEVGATASEWLRAAKKRRVSESSFWRAKRAFTSPQKEGLVIVSSDSRFRAVPPPEPPERDSGESVMAAPDSEQLSQLSEDYHDSRDRGTTITTITPLYRGDSSDGADGGPDATPRESIHQRLSADEADRARALLENPPPSLAKQLDKYRAEPDRFGKRTSSAVAVEVFGAPERWRGVMPLIEEATGVLRLIDLDEEGRL